ncbi:MAG: PH domain-containing protein [Thermoprotei archaeon]
MSSTDPNLNLKPVVSKSFVKGVIAVALFSLVLDVNSSNFGNYLIFLALYAVFLCSYAFYKRSHTYSVTDDGITIKSPFRSPRSVSYSDVVHVAVSQGFLAKRFNCGTVFVATRSREGDVRMMGGGKAEALRDVKSPQAVADAIADKLNPMG